MLSDIRFAFRSLFKTPGFTVVAILTIALGIGISTTIFNATNPLLFRSLPFRDTSTLVFLNESSPKQGFERMGVSYADFTHWRDENRVFSNIGIYDTANFTIGDNGEPERVEGCKVSSGLFATLGLEPTLGRGFAEKEDSSGAADVVLLGDGLWRRYFAADPQIIGRTISLNGKKHTVIGIMPRRVRFPMKADLWVPAIFDQPEKTHGIFSFQGVARLKPGVTLAQAKADLETIHKHIAAESPMTNALVGPSVKPIEDGFVERDLRTMGYTMLGTVAFVLAVACANVASLLLARALGRYKEFAIRQALGSGSLRIIQLLLVESLVLGLAGAALGFLFSLWGLDVVLSLVKIEIPYWIDFSPDARVISFTFGMSLLSSLLFGLAPAWQCRRIDVQTGLSESSRSSGSRSHQRLRSMLVLGQVALATMLLCGTGLMIRSLINLQRVDPGFNPARLAKFSLDLRSKPEMAADDRTSFYATLTERLQSIPGVQSVAACSGLPLSGNNTGQVFAIEGQAPAIPGESPVGNLRVVTPGYFATMEIRLLRGRDFSTADSSTSAKVIIIDAALARKYFGDTDPIGRHILWNRTDPASSKEIIGVAADVKHSGLDRDSRPGFYVPHAQNGRPRMDIVIRTSLPDPQNVIPAARHILRDLDPTLALFNPNTMLEVIGESYWINLFLSKLMSGFALLTVLLVAVGIAGVVAFAVAQRTREIGVRMALGALPGDVLRLIVGQGMRLVLIGLGIGLVASLGLGRLLASQLFGVGGADPITIVASTLLFSAVALLACWLPARRATRINPVEALRAD